MNIKKSIAILLILALVCLIFAACSNTKEEPVEIADAIVGDWASEDFDGIFVYTFNEDGTGNYDAAGTDLPFTYTVDGDKLSILFDGDDISFDTTCTISGDALTIKDSLDEDVVYKRK